MQIDWLTVAAQTVNFLILVLLLRRFLYGQIMHAMARREQAMADRERAATEAREAAEAERLELEGARCDLEARRDQELAQARGQAEALRRSLEHELRERFAREEHEWRRQLAEERAAFLGDVRRLVGEEFQRLARRALRDLAGADLEEQMIAVFLQRLHDLDDGAAEAFVAAARAGGGTVHVHTAFPVPTPARGRITRALHERLGEQLEVDYVQAPERVGCGIELETEGQSLSWTLDGYLDGLERELARAVPAPAPDDRTPGAETPGARRAGSRDA